MTSYAEAVKSSLKRVSLNTSSETAVTLFGVYSEGSLIAQQDNLPELTLGVTSSAHWTWSVVSTSEFSGQPLFWVTHPNPDDTLRAELHWSGIDNQDWEFGREGLVIIEATAGASKHTMTVHVAIRSLDQKDLTFYNYDTEYELKACKAAFSNSEEYSFELTADGGVSLDADSGSGTSMPVKISPEASGAFDAARDGWIDLRITSSKTVEEDGDPSDSVSEFRLRVGIRPLRVVGITDTLFGSAELEFVKGQPLEMFIEGEPSSTSGFTWEAKDLAGEVFKLTPSFGPLGRGSSAQLRLLGVSDWDWINGTSGTGVLVVRDGRRQAVELPLSFHLEKVPRSIFLAEGTALTGPADEQLEVAEDGEYLPVEEPEPDELGHPVYSIKHVPVRSVSSGAAANMPEGMELEFAEKQPLLGTATVEPGGLNMGDDAETDDELRDRVSVLWAVPPAHGNRSAVLRIAEQVEGVDRAFVYPPFALDGMESLGRVGCALVAPGRRSGVGRNTALAEEVRAALSTDGSMTAEYVMMDVDEVGEIDPVTGKGECQVDVEIQLLLENPGLWSWLGGVNLVADGVASEAWDIVVWCPDTDEESIAQVRNTLGNLVEGDQLRFAGRTVTVSSVDVESLLIHLSAPLLDEDGVPLGAADVNGRRIYPICGMNAALEAALDVVFKDLGTSEARAPEGELPWQRRFPRTNFRHPDELRVAEIVNQLMDIEGIVDARILTPAENVTPPRNEAYTDESDERVYKTYILSLRDVMFGPLLPTPGVDGLPGPTPM